MRMRTTINPVTLVGAGAWILALGTLFEVVWFFVALTIEPNAVCRTWSAGTRPNLTGAVGLTYEGQTGQLLAGGQIVLVVISLWMSVRGHAQIRRIGHLGLIGWAGLWLSNAIWFMTLVPTPMTRAVAWVLAILFACTVLRAVFNWNGKHVPVVHAIHARSFGA